ncbi:MAG: ankyrin repeat domain-containing protein [Alphaproteobacteria bacterium]|nr:ankyrin repeat domain-containing protein [Alphaproteobacteria bacterium]
MIEKDRLLLIDIFYYMAEKKWDKVKYLADRMSDIDYPIEEMQTVLLSACGYSCPSDVLKFLIEKKANVNQLSGSGRSPLDIALIKKNQEHIKILLENGAYVYNESKMLSSSQFSPLLSLLEESYGKKSGWQLIEENKQKENQLDRTGIERKTRLMLAALKKDVDAVHFLIENGAHLNLRDKEGQTALFYALYPDCFNKKETALDVAKLLIEAGADVLIKNYKGQTALMEIKDLYNNNCYKRCSLLSEPSYRDIFQERIQFMEEIEAQRMPIDSEKINQLGEKGLSLLMRAVCERNLPKVKRLIEAGADVNLKDKNSKTALFYALTGHQYCFIEKSLPIVQALVEAGADLSAKTKTGKTVFEYFKEEAEFLIRHRFDSYKRAKIADLCADRLAFLQKIVGNDPRFIQPAKERHFANYSRQNMG